MGRAPCCDKVGLKKGPWTSQEDQILTSFIENYGHSNWRALPKQAGLLRCGKSCRLRWINYLRPNIKRGNFTKEEEDTIIQLHDMMGNRWSAIAAKLPGRTDNEIKNVWHTYLKKRLNKQHKQPISHAKITKKNYDNTNNNATSSNTFSDQAPNTSLQSYSSDDFSSVTDVSSVEAPKKVSVDMDLQKYDANKQFEFDECPIIDDTFWSAQEVSYDDICMDFVFPDIIEEAKTSEASQSHSSMYIANDQANNIQGDDLDFWLDVFVRASEAPKLPEF